jgi:hypothetical protein
MSARSIAAVAPAGSSRSNIAANFSDLVREKKLLPLLKSRLGLLKQNDSMVLAERVLAAVTLASAKQLIRDRISAAEAAGKLSSLSDKESLKFYCKLLRVGVEAKWNKGKLRDALDLQLLELATAADDDDEEQPDQIEVAGDMAHALDGLHYAVVEEDDIAPTADDVATMDATTAAQTIKEVEASIQRRQQEQTLQFDVSRCQPLAVKVALDLELIRTLQRQLEDGAAAEASRRVRGPFSQMLRWQSKPVCRLKQQPSSLTFACVHNCRGET